MTHAAPGKRPGRSGLVTLAGRLTRGERHRLTDRGEGDQGGIALVPGQADPLRYGTGLA
jgi:hypothetical protein